MLLQWTVVPVYVRSQIFWIQGWIRHQKRPFEVRISRLTSANNANNNNRRLHLPFLTYKWNGIKNVLSFLGPNSKFWSKWNAPSHCVLSHSATIGGDMSHFSLFCIRPFSSWPTDKLASMALAVSHTSGLAPPLDVLCPSSCFELWSMLSLDLFQACLLWSN